MKFNEKIVRLRKTKGMTQEELVEAVGVSRQAVYKWECGQSYPEVAKLLELKLLFGISIDDLLDENYEVAVPEKKRRKRAPKVAEEAIAVIDAPTVEEVPEVKAEEEPAPEVKAEEIAPITEEPKKEDNVKEKDDEDKKEKGSKETPKEDNKETKDRCAQDTVNNSAFIFY